MSGTSRDDEPRDGTDLPGGVVTFVFTDIVGSTTMFRELGDSFPALLETHNALLRDVWHTHRGAEVKTEGDSFFVAFGDPADAVRGAVAAIEALASHPWPPSARIEVRVGMHTGVGYPRNGDYIAYPVHQAARIGAVGNGGQVVITPDTAKLLPELGDIALHTLGTYRVRDFDEAVELFQAERAASPTNFAPLRAQVDVQHNLPLDVREPLGRVRDIAGIADQLTQSRLVTIVGPGGVGKTLVALNLAAEQVPAFGDGVWFVDLSSHREAATLRGAVADALAVSPDDVVDHLAARHLLLVLDNAEQATADVGRFVTEATSAAPGLSVVVTSREPLAIAAERIWRLQPLAPAGAALELFAARALAVAPRFDIDAQRADVAELCERLDGLPLAIELAAARVTAMSVAEIIDSLSDRMRVLRSRRRDLDDRQRTASGLVDWSYQLLDENEQLVFRRLGVFAGHFDLDAATAASEDSGLDRIDVSDIVWSLIEKSLVMPINADGATRYRMLETVRAFAHRAMGEAGELAGVLGRVGHWYRSRFDPTKPVSRSAAAMVADEIPNLRTLAAALADSDPGLGQWLAWTVGLHFKTVDPRRGLEELGPIVEALTVPGEAVVGMLSICAHLANSGMDLDRSAAIVELGESFVGTSTSRPIGIGWLRNVSALNAIKRGRLADGRAIAEAAIEGASELELISLLNTVAIVQAELGELAEATKTLEEVLRLSLGLDAIDAEIIAVSGLAELAHRQGDTPQASSHTIDAIRMSTQGGLRAQSALLMIGAARLVADEGDFAEAIVLHAGAEALLAETGQTMFEGDRRLSDRLIELARESLGDQAFAHCERQGTELDYRQLVDRSQTALTATIALAEKAPD